MVKLSEKATHLRGQCWRDFVLICRDLERSPKRIHQVLTGESDHNFTKASSTATRLCQGRRAVSKNTRRAFCGEHHFNVCEGFYTSPFWRLIDPKPLTKTILEEILIQLPASDLNLILITGSNIHDLLFSPMSLSMLNQQYSSTQLSRLIFLLILFRTHNIDLSVKPHRLLVDNLKLQLAIFSCSCYVFPYQDDLFALIEDLEDGCLLFKSRQHLYFKRHQLDKLEYRLFSLQAFFNEPLLLKFDNAFHKFAEIYFQIEISQLILELEELHKDINYDIPNTGKGLHWLISKLNKRRSKPYQIKLPLTHRFKERLRGCPFKNKYKNSLCFYPF